MAEMTPAQRFGARVHAERSRLRWSMREVADRGGLNTQNTVFRAERGDELGLSNAVRIGAVLGISLDGLLPDASCEHCGHRAPRGFTCNVCGTRGRMS
jgi:transcriptional regulator with XRE-family HTH domain